MPLRSGGT